MFVHAFLYVLTSSPPSSYGRCFGGKEGDSYGVQLKATDSLRWVPASHSMGYFAAPHDGRENFDARDFKQEALSTIVPQGNLSAILAGKRKISATLAGKLAKFFGVSPALFIPH